MSKPVKEIIVNLVKALMDNWSMGGDDRYRRLAEKILKAVDEEFGE